MRAVKAAGVVRTTRNAGLVLAMVLVGLGLLPASAHAATSGVDVRASSMSGITAAAATPDGSNVFGAAYSTGTKAATTLALIGTNDAGGAPTATLVLSHTAAVALLADANTPSGGTTAVVIETIGSYWYADISPGWQGAGAPAAGSDVVSAEQPGAPKAIAIAPDASYAYVELSTGAIDAVDLTGGTVTPLLNGATPVVIANPSGGLALGPSSTGTGNALYAGVYNSAGTSAVNVGAVEEIPVAAAATTGTPKYAVLGNSGGSTQPTALTVDAGGDVYVGGSSAIGIALPTDFTGTSATDTADSSVGLAVYPLSTISCGSLALDNAANPAYLYCAPVKTSDLHLYRFAIPSAPGAGLTAAVGVPVSKAPTAVWGRGTAAGAYILAGQGIGYVDESSLSTQPAITSAPQPPRAVQASAVQTTDPSTGVMGAGIQVRWTEPAVDAQDVSGYSVSATAGSGAPYYCSNFTVVSGTSPAQYTCVIPGLVAGTAYTIAVQSTNAATTAAGLSSTPVLAPAPVYAGTPGATIAATTATGTLCATGKDAGYVVPTYTVSDTASGKTGSAILTWPTVNQDSCDPFTGQPLSSGVPNASNPNGSKTAGVSFYVLSAVDTATNKAITCTAATSTATSPSAKVSLAACGASAAPTVAEVPSSPAVPQMSARIAGLVPGHSYVFTVAANNSPSKPAGSSGAGTATYGTNWTGVATYAVPDETAATTITTTVSGTPSTRSVGVMDGDPNSSDWDYVAGGVCPAAYLSQAALYQSALYGVAASGVASCGAGSLIDPSYAFGEPTAPASAGITATSGSSSITVDWQATPNYTDHVAWGRQDVVGYTASASYTDPTGKTTTKTCATTGYAATGCTIIGLTNGTPYFVTVQANGGALGPSGYFVGSGSTPVTVTPVGYPAAPTTVTTLVPAITAGSKPWGEVRVSWTAPKDDGGSPLTAYQVVATPADPTVATPVTGYVTTDSTLAAAFGNDPDGTPYAAATSPLPTTYTFPQGSLTSQTSWSFTVAAHNAYLASGQAPKDSWGAFSTASPKAQPDGAPLPPTKVTATVTPTSITASWVAPTFTGGWPIAYYAVNVYQMSPPSPSNPGGSASVCVFGTSSSCTNPLPGCETTSTTCTVTDTGSPPNLTDGKSFYVTVQAYNQEFGATAPNVPTVASDESAPSNTLAKYGQPSPPTGVTATPGNASAFVTWTPAGAPGTPSAATGEGVITTYTATATAGASSKSCTAVPPATSCNITGLTNGTAYTIGVTESNAGAVSPPGYYQGSNGAIPVTPGTVPAAPTGVTANAGDQSVAVWWTAPKTTGGATITQYVATVLPGGATCTVALPAAPTCSIAGLTDGTTYTVSVVASNSFGDSVVSPAATFTPKGVPAAATGVQAFPQDRSATITWDAPADDGGSPITSYQAVAQPTTPGQGTLQSCTSTSPTSTGTGGKSGSSTTPAAPVPLTCTITGLTDGAQYTVYVVATSAAGQGAKSAPSPPFTPVGAPDPPTGVVAYTDLGGPTTGETTLHVGWTAPTNDGGSPIATYTATASNGQMCVVPGSAVSCDITGLQAGVKYTVTVVATNGDNYVSAPSAPSAPSSPAGPPAVPSHVVAVANQNAITVSWRKAKSNGAPITQYVLTLQPTGQVIYVNGSHTTAVITGLETTEAYRVTVQAQSGPTLVSGTSRASNMARPFAKPNRVAKPRAKVLRTGRTFKVVLGWKPPRTTGAPITAYVVHRVGGGSKTVRPKVHQVSFTGLKRNRTYAFWVAAVNAHGKGGASPSVVVKTHG